MLLRIALIGYLYGIPSERKLVEELRMHLAWRWFTGLGFDQEIPHHSTFSKNRHGRFQESKLFEQLFEQIVRQCVEVGLVQGQHLSVDGSFIEANAAKESRIPRQQLGDAAQVHHTVRQYLQEVEQQNPVEEPVHEQDQISTTDPDSTYATKGGTPARLGYYDNYLVDNDSCVIVGVQATAARMSQETVAAQDMLTRFAQWQGGAPQSVAADTTYGNGEFLQWLADRNITPYMRTRDSIHRKRTLGDWNHSVSACNSCPPPRWSFHSLDIHCGVHCALVTQLQRRATSKRPRSRDGRSHPLPDRVQLGILDRSFATAERDLRALITGYSAAARKRRAIPTCLY